MQSEAPRAWLLYKNAAILPVVNGWWVFRLENRKTYAVSFMFDLRAIEFSKLCVTSETVIMVPFSGGGLVME